eukprot:1737254-Rhodomonas_salina.1
MGSADVSGRAGKERALQSGSRDVRLSPHRCPPSPTRQQMCTDVHVVLLSCAEAGEEGDGMVLCVRAVKMAHRPMPTMPNQVSNAIM